MIYDFLPILLGAVVTAVLLTFEHFTLWSYRKKLPVTWRYALGTLAVSFGQSVALGYGAMHWKPEILPLVLIITPILVPLPGGALLMVYHWFHWLRGEELESARDAAMLHADLAKGTNRDATSNQERYSRNRRSDGGTINSA